MVERDARETQRAAAHRTPHAARRTNQCRDECAESRSRFPRATDAALVISFSAAVDARLLVDSVVGLIGM